MGIHKHTQHKEYVAPVLETSKTADMEKIDIPITQIDDEVKVVGEDRLQSDFGGHFSALIFCLLTTLSHKTLSLEFIFMEMLYPSSSFSMSPPVDLGLSRSPNYQFKHLSINIFTFKVTKFKV